MIDSCPPRLRRGAAAPEVEQQIEPLVGSEATRATISTALRGATRLDRICASCAPSHITSMRSRPTPSFSRSSAVDGEIVTNRVPRYTYWSPRCSTVRATAAIGRRKYSAHWFVCTCVTKRRYCGARRHSGAEGRHAVHHVDDEVDVTKAPRVAHRCVEVLAVRAAVVDDRVGTRRDRSAAEQRDVVTALLQPAQEEVDDDPSEPPAFRMREVPPRDEEDHASGPSRGPAAPCEASFAWSRSLGLLVDDAPLRASIADLLQP